jgi:YfiH family protein
LRLTGVAAAVPVTHGKIVHYHERVLNRLGTTRTSLVTANQVHRSQVVIVRTRPRLPIPDTDGLLTKVAGLPLGVYVADCCAVYLVDRKTPAIALLHSGRQGTRSNIAGDAVASMQRAFQSDPADILAVLSPCIGPCHYEFDIPGTIEEQLRAAGVREIVNLRVCTGCHVEHFYSYRVERGRTGRMLAVMMLV